MIELSGLDVVCTAKSRAICVGLKGGSIWRHSLKVSFLSASSQRIFLRYSRYMARDSTMRKFAYKDLDPAVSLRKVCDVSAPDCATLADWLQSRERFPEAAAAYEEYFRRGLDRVAVSNSVGWIVRYYQRSGRLRDARRIAEMAAGVGSARGMRALAGLRDREGDHEGAAALYRRILDRYDEGEDLLAG